MDGQGESAVSLEGKLGGRLTVWIGAIALALGGIFLVKYSIDQGWIRPELRVISGLAAGLGMALTAWKLRARSNYVAQGLAAAAVADVFACTWAAVNLYQMIPPEAGFAIMASTAAAAAIMSRGLGPIVAVVGLLGGFLTPLLLPGGDMPWLLFSYFLMLQAGTEVLARKPGQEWLSLLGFGAGGLWALAYLITRGEADNTLWVTAFGALSFTLYGLAGARPALTRQVVVYGSALLATISALAGLTLGEHSAASWMVLGTALVALIAVARARQDYAPLVWMAGAGALIATLLGTSGDVPAWRHIHSAVALSFGFALVTACAIGARKPAHWLHAGGLVSMGLLATVIWARWNVIGGENWMLAAAALALVHGGVAGVFWRLRREDAWTPAVYANIALAAAWPLGLDAQWFTLLWAVQLPAVMWLARRMGSTELRQLANVFGAAVFLSFTINPFILWYDMPAYPLLNWIAPAYAVAVGAMLLTHRIVPDHRLKLRNQYSVGAALMVLFGLLLSVRHLATQGVMHLADVSTAELAAYGAVGMVFGIGLRRLFDGRQALEEVGEAVLVLSTILYAVIVGVFRYPGLVSEPVGATPVFNMLAVIYLFPVLLAAGALALLRKRVPREMGAVMVGVVAPLFITWIALSIRHAFHGSEFWRGGVAGGEHLAYSMAMAAGAVAMLLWGLHTKHRGWRIAGLVAIGVCTCKVFLYDASGTEGIYRALSFMGLGAGLMGLGYLYNRFVIRDFTPKAELPAVVPAGGPVSFVPSTGEPAPGTPDHAA